MLQSFLRNRIRRKMTFKISATNARIIYYLSLLSDKRFKNASLLESRNKT